MKRLRVQRSNHPLTELEVQVQQVPLTLEPFLITTTWIKAEMCTHLWETTNLQKDKITHLAWSQCKINLHPLREDFTLKMLQLSKLCATIEKKRRRNKTPMLRDLYLQPQFRWRTHSSLRMQTHLSTTTTLKWERESTRASLWRQPMAGSEAEDQLQEMDTPHIFLETITLCLEVTDIICLSMICTTSISLKNSVNERLNYI